MMAINSSIFLFEEFLNYSDDDLNNYFYDNAPSNRISTLLYMMMEYFSMWHSQLSLVICTIGMLTNSLSIAVLTRKNIRSPSNTILTSLASSDGMKLLVYLVMASQEDGEHSINYSKTFLHLLCANIAMTLHAVSVSLTVTLVIFRYVTINFVGKGIKKYNNKLALKCIFVSSTIAIALCLPAYFVYTVEAVSAMIETNNDKQLYFINLRNNQILIDCNFWIQATLLKLLPCIMITIFSILTIKQIINNRFVLSRGILLRRLRTQSERMRKRQSNTTSIMLILVILLFLICEAPKIILLCMSGLNRSLFHEIQQPVGDLMDFITMVNSSANFMLFCCMNKKFRETITIFFKYPIKIVFSIKHVLPTVRAKSNLNDPEIKETQV